MGSIKKGILGGFSGKVGTVIGARWKGVQYMRGLSDKKSGAATPKQEVQRAKFAMAAKFLRPLQPLLLSTFYGEGGNVMTEFNSAVAYTLRNAITGVYPDLAIDYKLALIARGTLPNAPAANAVSANGTITFNWIPNPNTGIAKDTDKVVAVAYDVATSTATYSIGAALRSAGAVSLDLQGQEGQEVETWLAFISEDEKNVSPSVHTGKLVVS